MSIESVMPSNHLILCHPLLLLPSIFPSIRVFSSESALRIRWPKYTALNLITFSYDCHCVSDERTYPLPLRGPTCHRLTARLAWLHLLTSLFRHQLKPNSTEIQSEVEVREEKSVCHPLWHRNFCLVACLPCTVVLHSLIFFYIQ